MPRSGQLYLFGDAWRSDVRLRRPSHGPPRAPGGHCARHWTSCIYTCYLPRCMLQTSAAGCRRRVPHGPSERLPAAGIFNVRTLARCTRYSSTHVSTRLFRHRGVEFRANRSPHTDQGRRCHEPCLEVGRHGCVCRVRVRWRSARSVASARHNLPSRINAGERLLSCRTPHMSMPSPRIDVIPARRIRCKYHRRRDRPAYAGATAIYAAAMLGADLARIVVEDRRQPALGLRDAPALAPRIVLDLVALDLADAEIVRSADG